MKYVGRLVLVLQAVFMAGWVHAVTVTVNGNNCGSTTQPVIIDTTGNIEIFTNDSTTCAAGGSVGTGPFTLHVNKTGSGSGTVTSNTGGIDCGTACDASYDAGTAVQLTATAAEGSVFAGWSNGCSGTGSCSVTTTSNQSRTATFNVAGTTNCPAGVTCVTRNWPNIAQETITMKGNAVMAIQVNTTAAGLSGLLSTMYTTGTTGNRQVMLSTTPGSFDSANRLCFKEGLEVTSTSWQQQGTSRACQVPANSTAWINVRFTNCPATSNCSFYLKSN